MKVSKPGTIEIPQTGLVEISQEKKGQWNLFFALKGIYQKKSAMAIKVLDQGKPLSIMPLQQGQAGLDDLLPGKYRFILLWKDTPLSFFELELG